MSSAPPSLPPPTPPPVPPTPPPLDPYAGPGTGPTHSSHSTAYAHHSQRPHSALALCSLIFGIFSGVLSFFALGLITAIPGVLFGHIALWRQRQHPYGYSNSGQAIAGLIIGYICVATNLLLIFFLYHLVLFVEAFFRGSFK